MGFFSKLFGKKSDQGNIRERKGQPDVVDIQRQDDRMNWAMEKARLTLHYFEKTLKNPSPTQQYFSIKIRIEDGGKVEHIWLNDPSFDEDGNLYGVVGNEPIDVFTVKMGQKIGVNKETISDWMIIEKGRLIGGYTIRAIRDGLTGRNLKNFDRTLGGMFIDDGEDYFLPDDSTPEGAIVKLEEAFNNEDIEAAIACKDFALEAKLMLESMRSEDINDALIEKTSEVLKLSFLKSLKEHCIPNFKGLKQAFPSREKIGENHMVITEVCYYPDGSKSLQKLNTYKTSNGWKVLNPVN